jgi:hypothetical protein
MSRHLEYELSVTNPQQTTARGSVLRDAARLRQASHTQTTTLGLEVLTQALNYLGDKGLLADFLSTLPKKEDE